MHYTRPTNTMEFSITSRALKPFHISIIILPHNFFGSAPKYSTPAFDSKAGVFFIASCRIVELLLVGSLNYKLEIEGDEKNIFFRGIDNDASIMRGIQGS